MGLFLDFCCSSQAGSIRPFLYYSLISEFCREQSQRQEGESKWARGEKEEDGIYEFPDWESESLIITAGEEGVVWELHSWTS